MSEPPSLMKSRGWRWGFRSLERFRWLPAVTLGAWVLSSAAAPAGAGPEPEPDPELARARVSLEAVRRLKNANLEEKPALKKAVDRLAEQFRGQPEFVELVRDFHLQSHYPHLLDFAVSHAGDPSGVEALRALLTVDPGSIGRGLANSNQAPVVVRLLGETRQKDSVPWLLPVLRGEGAAVTLQDRRSALRALIAIQDGAQAVLKLASEGALSSELKPLAGAELAGVRWSELKAEAAKVRPPPTAPLARGDAPLPPVAELVRRSGNAANGAKQFRRPDVACISCHQVAGEGVDFGPKLTEIGTKLGKDALYDAILEPSAGIAFGYEGWSVTLKNGDESLGLLVSNTEDELAVKVPGGLVYKCKKAEVVKLEKQKASMMPEGLIANLTVSELVDLVEYLASLKNAGP